MIKETLHQEPGTIRERINARVAAKPPESAQETKFEELDAVLRQEGYLCGPAQIIRHEYGSNPDRVKVKLGRNTKGFNWEISATASTVDEALAMIADAKAKIEKAYGAGRQS